MVFPARLLAAVVESAARNDLRFYLNAVHFEGPFAVATNGHTMTVARVPGIHNPGVTVNQPSTPNLFAERLHKRPAYPMRLDAQWQGDEANGVWTLGDLTMQAQENGGRFPNWRKVLPKNERFEKPAVQIAHRYLALIARTARCLRCDPILSFAKPHIMVARYAKIGERVCGFTARAKDEKWDAMTICMPMKGEEGKPTMDLVTPEWLQLEAK